MDLIAYIRIFRRRWPLVVLPAVIGLALAWATLPEQQQAGPVIRTYRATATLIATPDFGGTSGYPVDQTTSLSTVALFATIGDVPKMAAKTLGYEGEPQILASQVNVMPGTDTSTLSISSSDPEAKTVTARVNAFADATVKYFRRQEAREARGRIRALQQSLDGTTAELQKVQSNLALDSDDPILQARMQALQAQYSTQYGEVASLTQQLGGTGPLKVLQPGVAIPQTSGGGFVAPTDPFSRLGIAGLLGLLLGAALALVVERLDSRLRTREQVEDAYGLPVLAEIPTLPASQRKDHEVLSAERPASATAEAYRNLRSAILLLGPNGNRGSTVAGQDGIEPMVVMVTSALPGEGKTTTVANLAAVMAEAGRRVVVLSFDLRNPRLHEYFDVSDGTGLSDLLAADRAQHLEQVLRETQVPGVRVATSGQELGHPGALLASAGPLLNAARDLADVVLIDTAPVLTVSDAVDLAQHVDVAVVVTRLNKTTNGHAAAAQRLLSRLGVPALGTVLVGSQPQGTQDSYILRNFPGRDSLVRPEGEHGKTVIGEGTQKGEA